MRLMTQTPPKKQPRWKRRRRITALRRQLKAKRAKRLTLRRQETAARRKRDTRRKYLAGLKAVARLQERPRLDGWMRRVLGEELAADDQKAFGLAAGAALIPERELRSVLGQRQAPSRHDDDPAAARPDSSRGPRMSSAQRRQLIAQLEREEEELKTELEALLKEDAEDNDGQWAPNHRLILLGAALLKRARRQGGVARWLRVLLGRELRAARDRKLFRLGQPGHLVPDEDVEEEENAERPRTRKKSAAATGAQGADAKRGGCSRPSAAVSEGVAGGRRSRGPTAGGGGAAPPPDAGAPIPGWRPRRITAADSPEAGARKQPPDWGAVLTGHAAVAALPAELRGRTITVTDSNRDSWNTIITAVVSRDDASVLVRNSGRPRAGLSPARHLRGYLGEREPRFR